MPYMSYYPYSVSSDGPISPTGAPTTTTTTTSYHRFIPSLVRNIASRIHAGHTNVLARLHFKGVGATTTIYRQSEGFIYHQSMRVLGVSIISLELQLSDVLSRLGHTPTKYPPPPPKSQSKSQESTQSMPTPKHQFTPTIHYISSGMPKVSKTRCGRHRSTVVTTTAKYAVTCAKCIKLLNADSVAASESANLIPTAPTTSPTPPATSTPYLDCPVPTTVPEHLPTTFDYLSLTPLECTLVDLLITPPPSAYQYRRLECSTLRSYIYILSLALHLSQSRNRITTAQIIYTGPEQTVD